MNNSFRLKYISILFLSGFLNSCNKSEIPVVETSEITEIKITSASGGGIVIDEGSGEIIEKGVCCGTVPEPTIANKKTSDGSGSGPFISNISGLIGGTTYFVRAYATNSAGTGYGLELSFTTTQSILKVPADFPTISQAVEAAEAGDTIIISPGTYYENNITINKAITISSEWKLTGDVSRIEETIVDSQDKILFTITADGVEISGLRIINGNHTLNIEADVSVIQNHFVHNLDAMSFESAGGGYAGNNTVENDRDDGLDSDIIYNANNHGSNLIIENNTIINSNDDGIEIRLYSYANQNINYILRGNKIKGSKNAGIQIISYDVYTGKKFQIHHNIITGCKTGLGCMDGSNTSEDLTGALYMDEQILLFNNTLVDNQMGATGGNYVIAVNNIVKGNSLGGFKRFGSQSAVINNLFFGNGVADFIEISESVPKTGNILSVDPLLDINTFTPSANSPCIDSGTGRYEKDVNTILEVPAKYISGSAPDIGAVELNR